MDEQVFAHIEDMPHGSGKFRYLLLLLLPLRRTDLPVLI